MDKETKRQLVALDREVEWLTGLIARIAPWINKASKELLKLRSEVDELRGGDIKT